jgi:diguanylate cyclase (GGDEF)-like protein/PAS domain S-box-containing protein
MALDVTDQVTTQRILRERELQLRLIVNQLPAALWTTDSDLMLTSISGAAAASLVAPGSQTLGVHVDRVFGREPGNAPSRMPAAHAAALLGNRVRQSGWFDGRYFDVALEPLVGDGGEIVGVLGIGLDITEQQDDRRALERRTDELHAAQAIAHFGSWSIDLHTDEVHWSPELYRIVGEDPADATIEKSLFLYDHPDDVEAVRAAIAAAERDRTAYDIEHRIVRRDGSIRAVREQGAFDFDEFGRAVRCVGTVLDVTERKTAEERLAYLAHHDPLTDLPNRTLLHMRLEHAVERAARSGDNAATLFLDLDRFKYINDTFGHVVGDELLVQVSQRLVRTMRAGDTVARPGGDEFVIVLESIESPERASELAQRIRREFTRPFELSVGPQFITASIGIAMYPFDGLTPDDLLRAADAAMYRSKERGGNDFQFFTPQLHEAAMRQLELGNALRIAIERRDVYVAFQPIYRAKDGVLTSVEALARWNRGDLPPVAPADFVRIAEETGVIRELGESVLRQSCEQMSEWVARGLPVESIAVNISPHQLNERGFVSRVAEILVATRLAPNRLELEITESAFVDGNDEAFAAIAQLRQLGVRFAIDDFGTGYSSLAYIKRIPADTIKIDRSFITDMNEKTDRAIVEAVITVGRILGKRLIAEGVETPEQLAILNELECEYVQGYFFSRPVDPETFALLAQTNAPRPSS